MEELTRLLGQSITRYILPGMIFYLFLIFIPVAIYFYDDVNFVTSPIFIIITIISAGYLLDAIGAYRYPSPKKYEDDKKELLQNIKAIENIQSLIGTKLSKINDPDIFMSIIWYHDYPKYKSIFDERSEWVMILISSFVLLLSAFEYIFILIYLICTCNYQCWMLPTIMISSGILFLAWYFSSNTGIQRMKAHDKKIVYCLTKITKKSLKKTI